MKRGPLLITILSFVAIAVTVAWPALRISSAYASGQEAARADFSELRRQAINTISVPEDVAGEAWRTKAAVAWSSQRGLLAVVVKDSSGEVLYAKPSSSPYYKRTPDGLAFERPEGTTTRYKGSLSAGLSIEALYVVLSQEEVFYPLRDVAIALAALSAIVGAGLILSSGERGGRGPGRKAEPPSPIEAESPGIEESSLYHESVFDEIIVEPESVEANDASASAPVQAASEARPGFVEASELPEGALDGPRGLFDAESGLGWEAYLRERLSSELRRSASFEQDLSLLLTSFNGAGRGEADFNLFASIVRDFFSFKDMAFLFGDDGSASILPNMDVDHALRMCEELQKKLGAAFPDRQPKDLAYFGLSSRAGRLVDADRIIGEAMAALNKARKDGGSSILAFRPDPERFRAYLASS